MKRCHVNLAAQALRERASLVDQCDSSAVQILIRGKYMDDDMVAAALPSIVAELERRISEIDEDLASWGVEPPADAR
ncbi:MAG: hypothetical protein ACTHM0_13400 [Sphingomonas sp.]